MYYRVCKVKFEGEHRGMWNGKTVWEYVREYYVKSEVGLLGVVDT